MARKITRLRIAMCLGALSLIFRIDSLGFSTGPTPSKTASGRQIRRRRVLPERSFGLLQRLVACIMTTFPSPGEGPGRVSVGRYGVENIDKMVANMSCIGRRSSRITRARGRSRCRGCKADQDSRGQTAVLETHLSRYARTCPVARDVVKIAWSSTSCVREDDRDR